jgi:phosphatidylinositol glycan class K
MIRYHEILFMSDTCQAGSLSEMLYAPNVLTIGSSRTGQNSYSGHPDPDTGNAWTDR